MAENEVRKRINFYQLQAGLASDKNKRLSKDEINYHLRNIVAQLETNSAGYKYKQFVIGFNDYIIEFLKHDESFLFARIGKRTDGNNIGKRDTLSGNLINIELGDSETIEAYTYLYLDLTNMILSYLVLSGTPSRTSFSYFLDDICEGIKFECVPVATDDVIRSLAQKSILGTIEFSYCTPNLDALNDVPGIDKDYLSSLEANKTVITVSLRPSRSKSITKDIKSIFNIKKELQEKHGSNLKSLRMNAKDIDEEAINYNLLDYKFASYTYISMISLKTEEDLYKIITNEYKKMVNVLKNYIV